MSLEKYVADYLEEEHSRANEENGFSDSFWEYLPDHIENAIKAYNGGAR